ncbi:helix-loop-helix DNA-binding domain-containing protein [Xylariaceae sp. FL0016]|nr:helix-loop-helix DNA-binding domain-containing protein [Xylariaceae sp. FL0016]
MAQHSFNYFGGGLTNGGSVDPNELAMSGSHGASFSNNFNGNNSSSGGFFDDEELGEGLTSAPDPMSNQSNMHNQGHGYGGMNDLNMGFQQGMYASHQNNGSMAMDQPHMNGYSNTPDGEPIQSPYVHSYTQSQFGHIRPSQTFGNSLQSPVSYSGSPLANSDLNADGNDPNYLNAKSRAQMSQSMQRKASNTRSPLTPKTAAAMSAIPMNSRESSGFSAQPIRTPAGHQDKSPSAQWMHTPNSMSSFSPSAFPSPMTHGIQNTQNIAGPLAQSMPNKLSNSGANTVSVANQEMKRKRRRESHNLVERRRRDNINERIQDLSKLVPTHRLEDDKIRKLIQNGTPLSPSLTGIASPGQATSGLAGPGAKRATGAGNITTGLPLDDKDKGPNKGDILNGAVSWTRDLMWLLQLKIQQQEELVNLLREREINVPFDVTDDEQRMQTELMEAFMKSDSSDFAYSRTHGSGLRVPQHTNYKGDAFNGTGNAAVSISPDVDELVDLVEMGDPIQWSNVHEDPEFFKDFKEEDEFEMELTQD